MTGRLPTFTPTEEYKTYRVGIQQNRWDTDEGKFTVTVHAIGSLSAKELAMEQVRDRYPDAVALSAEVAE